MRVELGQSFLVVRLWEEGPGVTKRVKRKWRSLKIQIIYFKIYFIFICFYFFFLNCVFKHKSLSAVPRFRTHASAI